MSDVNGTGIGWSILDWIVRNSPVFLAGATGGLVRSLHRRDGSLWSLMLSSLGGAIFAFYGSPVVGAAIWYWVRFYQINTDIERQQIIGLSGFLCGVAGFPITEALIRYVASRWKDKS